MKRELACAWRRRILVLGMVLLGLVSPQVAGATAGGATDPVDNEVGVDIVRVGHTDSATEIQYSLEAAGAIGTSAQQEFDWSLDLGGGYGDIVIQFNASSTTATVDCTSGTDATATVTHAPDGSAFSTATNTVVVRFPRSALTACGLVGNQYRYVVSVDRTDVTGVVDDVVPDTFLGGAGITHTLTPVPPTSTTTVASSSTTTVPPTSTTTVPPTSMTSTSAPASSSAPLTISPASVAAGGVIHVQAGGFAPGSSVTVLLFSDPLTLATGKANPAGNVDLTVTIPVNTSRGQHRVVVRGTNPAGGVREAAATLTVSAAANRTVAGPLARTGSSAQMLLLVAAVLMLAGLTMELSSHRRQPGSGASADGASHPPRTGRDKPR